MARSICSGQVSIQEVAGGFKSQINEGKISQADATKLLQLILRKCKEAVEGHAASANAAQGSPAAPFGSRGTHTTPPSPTSRPSPASQPSFGGNYNSSPALAAELVSDMDVEMASDDAYTPNTEIFKCWRLRNSGSQPWPQTCGLRFAGVHGVTHPLQTDAFVQGIALPPGEVVEITVKLTTPDTPGQRTFASWQLVTDSAGSTCFGNLAFSFHVSADALQPRQLFPSPRQQTRTPWNTPRFSPKMQGRAPAPFSGQGGGSSPPARSLSGAWRTCSQCREPHSRESYSKTQWGKPEHQSRCARCINGGF